MGRIERIGQQDPLLRLLVSGYRIEKVGLFLKFDLIGLLIGEIPGRVPSSFDIVYLSGIELCPVR